MGGSRYWAEQSRCIFVWQTDQNVDLTYISNEGQLFGVFGQQKRCMGCWQHSSYIQRTISCLRANADILAAAVSSWLWSNIHFNLAEWQSALSVLRGLGLLP